MQNERLNYKFLSVSERIIVIQLIRIVVNKSIVQMYTSTTGAKDVEIYQFYYDFLM